MPKIWIFLKADQVALYSHSQSDQRNGADDTTFPKDKEVTS